MKQGIILFRILLCLLLSPAVYSQSSAVSEKADSKIILAEMDSARASKALFHIYNLQNLNTPGEEFSPVLYKTTSLVFVKQLPRDMTTTRDGSKGFFTVVQSQAIIGKDSVSYKPASLFSPKINSQAHNGPVCFTSSGDTIYFTRTEINDKGKLVSNIYRAGLSGNTWKSPEPVRELNDSNSSMHPALSPDGKTLFFASDRPGGFGGLDLYMTHKNGENWGKPENLGMYVNTSFNELFPSVDKNGTLYFSSAGHDGFGGLDLFSAYWEGKKYGHVSNLMPPMNSGEDDFGMTFREGGKGGYFSSNRKGGKGGDDLYGFSFQGKPESLSGRLMLNLKPGGGASEICMVLISDKGFPLQHTCTDSAGNFHFDFLPANRQYTIEAEPENRIVVKGSRLYLVDSKGRAVSVTVINEKGKYVFSALPADLSVMDPVQEEDTEIKGQSLTGSFIYGPNKTPLSNKTVSLLDADNHVVQTVKTNYFGAVLFTNIPPGADYSVAIVVDDPKIKPEKVYFVSKTGNPIEESNKKLGFRYSLLARDKAKVKELVIDDTQLRVNIKGILYKDRQGTQPIAHIAVDLLNTNGQITQTCMTDDHGLFKFSHKVNKEVYTVSVSDTTNKEIYIADENGKVLDKMRIKNGKFVYQILPYIHTSLTELVVDDPWIDLLEGNSNGKESLVIVESIYYKYQDWSVTPEAEVILNKVISVMNANPKLRVELSSHTDSRGSDAFNMQLSQKRADSGVKYMVSKGVDPKRITGKGYGETRLLNRCGNGVTCTDEEHQINRRAEFKVVWDK